MDSKKRLSDYFILDGVTPDEFEKQAAESLQKTFDKFLGGVLNRVVDEIKKGNKRRVQKKYRIPRKMKKIIKRNKANFDCSRVMHYLNGVERNRVIIDDYSPTPEQTISDILHKRLNTKGESEESFKQRVELTTATHPKCQK